MAKEITPQEALHRAAALCSTSEMCRSDVLEKLTRWGIDLQESEEIVKRLTQEKFIDESRFCRGYVNDKFRFSRWGRIKIRYHLRQKQIGSPLIEEALLRIDESEYEQALSWLLKEKAKSTKGANEYDKAAKLARFAASRGFEQYLIFKLLKHGNRDEDW